MAFLLTVHGAQSRTRTVKKYKATPHNHRLTAMYVITCGFSVTVTKNSFDIRQYACVVLDALTNDLTAFLKYDSCAVLSCMK